MIILNGKELAQNIQNGIKSEIDTIKKSKNIKPMLCGVIVGNDAASLIYVKNKSNACHAIGMDFKMYRLKQSTTQSTLNNLLDSLSADANVNGILLQLPLPMQLNPRVAVSHISPEKDVDGLTNDNMGKLVTGENTGLVACTAMGIMELLEHYNIEIASKHCVIVGRSLLVGKPLMSLLLAKDGFVTVCHSKTPNLQKYTKQADILITAVGKKNLITSKYVKRGAIVVDVAIVRENTHVFGDVDFEKVSKKVHAISPVPGGVGPLTVAELLKNTLLAFKRQNKIK